MGIVRPWFKGQCKFMVIDSVSRVMGKRPCDRPPVKGDLCAFHQPEKVKARYDRLMEKHGGKKSARVSQPRPSLMELRYWRAAIRQAVADYMASEGCRCCQDVDAHEQHKEQLAKLLDVQKYPDGSGYNFFAHRSTAAAQRRKI